MGFFDKFFGKTPSAIKAKERLQLVLIHDRSDLSPGVMENLRNDIIEVIKNYLDIDDTKIELNLEREDRSVALVANIPVRNVKRGRAG